MTIEDKMPKCKVYVVHGDEVVEGIITQHILVELPSKKYSVSYSTTGVFTDKASAEKLLKKIRKGQK